MTMNIKNRPLRIAIVLCTGAVAALTITATGASFQKKSAERYAALTRVGNCQTDVVAPFVQRYDLHRVANGPQSFRQLVTQEVAAGRIPEGEARKALSAIEEAKDGMPVRTSVGWTLPTVSDL